MAISILGQTGTADPIEAEYITQDPANSPVRIHMHLDAVDGIARDVVEGFRALPRRGVEVGGLLLGHVEPGHPGTGDRPVVWIERYQRIECQHRFGPQFVLDEEDHATLDRAAGVIAETSELSIVGLYRSHTRPGFQLEQSDFDIIGRYFSDPADILLLIKPENLTDISAQFFARGGSGDLETTGTMFPFRGHVIGDIGGMGSAEPAVSMDEQTEREPPAAAADAAAPAEDPKGVEPSKPERMRRLVPDFAPAEEPVRPAREFFMEQRPAPAPALYQTSEREPTPLIAFARKWWPLLGALALVGGAVWFLFQSQTGQRESPSGSAASETASVRPLGLYVDPSGQTWRVSWNASATALRGARAVQLFVRDGEDQNRIDLAPPDLASGTYQYQPKSQDVTFRLEVTDGTGHVSAESFRMMKPATATAIPAKTPAPGTQGDTQGKITPPAAIRKVPPVVPASIRPRIKGSIPINVRVQVDARGRVTSASPLGKPHTGLQSYLAERAVYAARQWRFEPARQNGKAVPGAETIHFTFEK